MVKIVVYKKPNSTAPIKAKTIENPSKKIAASSCHGSLVSEFLLSTGILLGEGSPDDGIDFINYFK